MRKRAAKAAAKSAKEAATQATNAVLADCVEQLRPSIDAAAAAAARDVVADMSARTQALERQLKELESRHEAEVARLQEQVRLLDHEGVRARVAAKTQLTQRIQVTEHRLDQFGKEMEQLDLRVKQQRGSQQAIDARTSADAKTGADALVLAPPSPEQAQAQVQALMSAVETQIISLGEALESRLGNELQAQVRGAQEQAVETALAQVRLTHHIDSSKLESKCNAAAERLTVLERTMAEEQRTNLEALEALYHTTLEAVDKK